METTKPASLVALEARIAEGIAQGYTPGDVNHYVNPIIGMLRLRLHRREQVTTEDVQRVIEALEKATNAETALLAFLDPSKYGLEDRNCYLCGQRVPEGNTETMSVNGFLRPIHPKGKC